MDEQKEPVEVPSTLKKALGIIVYVCLISIIIAFSFQFIFKILNRASSYSQDNISNADRLIILEIPNNPDKYTVNIPSLDGTVNIELFVMRQDLEKFRARINELVKEDDKELK